MTRASANSIIIGVAAVAALPPTAGASLT